MALSHEDLEYCLSLGQRITSCCQQCITAWCDAAVEVLAGHCCRGLTLATNCMLAQLLYPLLLTYGFTGIAALGYMHLQAALLLLSYNVVCGTSKQHRQLLQA